MYSPYQWLFFFFLYSICGFIWETLYVSARAKRFEERGFLHGPYLPIYGFGAVMILLATLPVQKNILLIYIFGLVAATALEYATGVAMEKLFHVRYWDYSYRKYQYKGHICLHSSIGWGFFSVLLVKVIHPFVEGFVLEFNAFATQVIVLTIGMLFSLDTYISTREALDLRAMLIKLAESNEEIQRIKKRIDVKVAFAEADLEEFKEDMEEDWASIKAETKAEVRQMKEHFKLNVRHAQARTEAKLDRMQARVENFFEEVEDEAKLQREELLQRIDDEREKLHARIEKNYNGIYSILKRNPDAVSRLHKEELEEILKMLERK